MSKVNLKLSVQNAGGFKEKWRLYCLKENSLGLLDRNLPVLFKLGEINLFIYPTCTKGEKKGYDFEDKQLHLWIKYHSLEKKEKGSATKLEFELDIENNLFVFTFLNRI
jgi:hypothetical protein